MSLWLFIERSGTNVNIDRPLLLLTCKPSAWISTLGPPAAAFDCYVAVRPTRSGLPRVGGGMAFVPSSIANFADQLRHDLDRTAATAPGPRPSARGPKRIVVFDSLTVSRNPIASRFRIFENARCT